MPYILNKTNGKQIAVIQDGTINNTSADLIFVGKNYSGYGQVVNENFLQLLENFANPVAPSKPVIGELWYDSGNKKLCINTTGTAQGWKKLALINNTEAGYPLDQTLGDFYWDSSLQKLYLYNGSDYVLIGPLNSGSAAASGAVIGTLTDNNNQSHPVLLLQIDGDTPALIADFSATTTNQDPLYVKYPTVGKGLSIQGSNNVGISWPTYSLWGTASSARGLVRASDNYSILHTGDDFLLQSELAGFSGSINLQTDDGIYVGKNRIAQLHVQQNTQGALSNIQSTRFNFNVTRSNVLTEVFHIDGSNAGYNQIVPNPILTTNIGATGTGNSFNKLYSSNLISSTLTAPGAIEPTSQPASGSGIITGNWTVNGNISVSGGAITATTAGLATNANNLQNATSDAYIHAKIDASTNSILQLDSDGYANMRGLAGYVNPKIKGTWTLDSQSSLQASSLKNATGSGYITPTVSGTPDQIKDTLVQRDASGGITGVAIYGASLQSPTLRASTDPQGQGTIYGQWQIGTAATFQATSLAGTGGYFAATTDGTQANTIVQRDVNKNVSANDFYGSVFHGTSTAARYADLAEKYTTDAEYEPGTVLVLGGEKETTLSTSRASINVAGIVSTNPAHLMNSTIDGVAIALSGRVPCKVIGPINKGDLLVTSSTPGYAEAYRDGDSTLAVLGRSLETLPEGPGVIEVKV